MACPTLLLPSFTPTHPLTLLLLLSRFLHFALGRRRGGGRQLIPVTADTSTRAKIHRIRNHPNPSILTHLHLRPNPACAIFFPTNSLQPLIFRDSTSAKDDMPAGHRATLHFQNIQGRCFLGSLAENENMPAPQAKLSRIRIICLNLTYNFRRFLPPAQTTTELDRSNGEKGVRPSTDAPPPDPKQTFSLPPPPFLPEDLFHIPRLRALPRFFSVFGRRTPPLRKRGRRAGGVS